MSDDSVNSDIENEEEEEETPPPDPAQPEIHVHVGETKPKKKQNRWRFGHAGGGTTAQRQERADAAAGISPDERRRRDEIEAFMLPWATARRAGIAYHCKIYREKPEFFNFGDGRGLVRIGAGVYLDKIDDPGLFTEEYIQDRWGGGTYTGQVVGPDKRTGKGYRIHNSIRLTIDGDPKPTARIVGSNGGNTQAPPASPVGNPEEARLVSQMLTDYGSRDERRDDQVQGLLQRNEQALRDIAEARHSEAAATARAEALEARLAVMEKGGSMESQGLLTLMAEMRRDADRRHEMEMKRLEQAAHATSPIETWFKLQADTSRRDQETADRRHQREMEQQRQHFDLMQQQQRDFFGMQLEHLQKRADGKDDLLAQVDKVVKLRDALDAINPDKDEGPSASQLIEKTIGKLPELMKAMPALAAGIRHGFTGQPLPGMQPQLQQQPPPAGAVGGAPEKSAEEKEAIARMERLVGLLEATLANGLPTSELVRTLRNGFPGEMLAAVAGTDPEEVIKEIRKHAPQGSSLHSVAGAEHMRTVHAALRS